MAVLTCTVIIKHFNLFRILINEFRRGFVRYISNIRFSTKLKVLSTTHALADMFHTLLLTAEERKASHVVLLDPRKAFDHVDNSLLITKWKDFDLPNFII